MTVEHIRLVITGGGTGGHLGPAVAVIEALRALDVTPSPELLYLGSRGGAEARVIPVLGVPYKAITTGKLRRYLSIENLLDAFRVPLGIVQALAHLARFRPHALLATGGYVSVPPVIAAWLLRCPVLLHEQTGSLGLANRINARFATKLALSVPGSEEGLPPRRSVLTGNPVRSVVRNGSRTRGLQRFQLSSKLPTVYVTGGAQGAHALNELVRGSLPRLLRRVQLIHQCGDTGGTNADYEALTQAVYELPTELRDRYVLQRYFEQEIGDVYAVSDLVVGRAGAGTVNELAILQKPALLIPLPASAGDEQLHNARRLERTGAAMVLDQDGLTPKHFADEVLALALDVDRLVRMRAASPGATLPDPATHIARLLLKLAGAHTSGQSTERA
ncbi:MAG: undecaprenyldiphospho-muramoylpentapeptide beta-N-acetylglucosaminyltransferase [Chloroflexota bacterium]|nr:undecaprenyldiphospho-muramoylpentapeptide beta-N-acetylglucosaminyltransferase [Chloroflexota bacterium]